MIWLAWRRHRLSLGIVAGLVVALGIWMAYIRHYYSSSGTCHYVLTGCPTLSGVFPVPDQAVTIYFIALALPCVIGLALGAPLIANELEHYTNRLVWTQGISRVRWVITKWLLVGASIVIFLSLFALVEQAWLVGVAPDRMQPTYFDISGVVPIAYGLFAFSLGAALGAIVRRTTWAVIGTVVCYTACALLMVFVIRPSLVPSEFRSVNQSTSGFSVSAAALSRTSWQLGIGYRYETRAYVSAAAPSAAAVAQRCQDDNYNYPPYLHCLATHDVEQGSFFQPPDHYWPLQWREAAIYFGMSILLLSATLCAARRWST